MSESSMITKETAIDIAMAYREIETAAGLLEEVKGALLKRDAVDLRDAFGRRVGGLELGVPIGKDGHRLFNVPYGLAVPIIEAHIAHHRATIAALTLKTHAALGPYNGGFTDSLAEPSVLSTSSGAGCISGATMGSDEPPERPPAAT